MSEELLKKIIDNQAEEMKKLSAMLKANSDSLSSIRLISGRSNPELAKLISEHLGIKLVECDLGDFGNTEVKIKIEDNVRNCDVVILQTGSYDKVHSINDYLMETMALISACKLSNAKSITVNLACFPYARSDKKDAPRVPIMAKLVADMLQTAGATRVVSVDLHAAQIQGFFNIPFDNLFAIKDLILYLNAHLFKNMKTEERDNRYVLVSPDEGGARRVKNFANQLKMNFVILDKTRDYRQPGVVLKSILVGDRELIKDKTCIIIDDMVDTCGTMVSAAKELKNYGAGDVIIMATHGVFSGPAFERLNACDLITKAIVTNTLPQAANQKKSEKLEVVDISGLLAEVIKRLQTGESISELFN